MSSLQWLILIGVIALSLISEFRNDYETREILQQANAAAQEPEINGQQHPEQDGYVNSSVGKWRFSTAQLQAKIAKLPSSRRHHFYTWSADKSTEITGSASGIDKLPYFANSYLIGYSPFKTESIWEPLATLALRKNYILDHELYGPELGEIWQNSRQAYKYTRGDCEDHAIILADWLISMGHDARVVLGKYKNGGHAWVVLYHQNIEYILEATSKQRPRNVSDFLLARLATDYQPMYQFDRHKFWVNTGSVYTTKYRDAKWQVRSEFIKASKIQSS